MKRETPKQTPGSKQAPPATRTAAAWHWFLLPVLALLFLGAQLLLTVLLPAETASPLRFWGGNACRFLPGWLTGIVLGGTLLGIAWIWSKAQNPPASPAPGAGSAPGPASADRPKPFAAPRFLGPSLILAAFAVFWLLRSRYALLGDNWLRVQQAKTGDASPYEMGIMGLYNFLGRLFASLGMGTMRQAFVAVSLVSGLIYAGVAWLTAKHFGAGTRGALLIFAGFMACGTVELFCGYIEVYPLILAMLLLVTWTALRAVAGKAPPYLPVLLIALTILLHRLAVLWIPAALAPLWFRRRGHSGRAARTGVASLLLIGAAAAVVGGGRFSVLLPLLPSPERQYAVLSLAHISDFMNAQFLGSVAGFFLAPVFLIGFFRSGRISPARALCLLAWLPPAAGLFFFRPLLGGADWDLLALAAPFAFLFVVASLADEERGEKTRGFPSMALSRPALALGVLLSVWNTLPWLCLARSEASLTWVRHLLATDRADYFQGHPAPLHLAALFESNGLFDRQREELLRGTQEIPDDPRFPYNLAVWAVNRKQWEDAERFAVAAYRIRRDYVPALEILYEADKALGKREDQILAGQVIRELHRTQPSAVERYLPRERLEQIGKEVEALARP